MKKIFTFLIVLLIATTTTIAQDTLYIFKTDASMTKMPVADIDSITFFYEPEDTGGNGGIELLGDDGTVGSVTDLEGNVYKTVLIGGQEWMAQDLKVTKLNDGTDINGLDYYVDYTIEDWRLVTDPVYSIYQQPEAGNTKDSLIGLTTNEEVVAAYGMLYNWYAASSGNICPDGWRVPTVDDFQQLEDYLKNDYGMVDGSGGEPGKTSVTSALRSCRQVMAAQGGGCAVTDHPRWDEGFFPGIDLFGFAGLPGGYMYGKWKQFEGAGKVARWWCQEEKDGNTENGNLWDMNINEEYGFANRNYPKYYQYSIRCVKE